MTTRPLPLQCCTGLLTKNNDLIDGGSAKWSLHQHPALKLDPGAKPWLHSSPHFRGSFFSREPCLQPRPRDSGHKRSDEFTTPVLLTMRLGDDSVCRYSLKRGTAAARRARGITRAFRTHAAKHELGCARSYVIGDNSYIGCSKMVFVIREPSP